MVATSRPAKLSGKLITKFIGTGFHELSEVRALKEMIQSGKEDNTIQTFFISPTHLFTQKCGQDGAVFSVGQYRKIIFRT